MVDNVSTLAANQVLCTELGLKHYTLTSAKSSPPPDDIDVLFVLNFTTEQRSALLLSPNTLALMYTPTNEHFGIVPVEAMACGVPVLACNTGGPTETIVGFDSPGDEKPTGFLRAPEPEEWAPALAELINLKDRVNGAKYDPGTRMRADVAAAAKERVQLYFSSQSLGRQLEEACRTATKAVPHTSIGDGLITVGLSLVIFSLGGLYLAMRLGGVAGVAPPANPAYY
jgi:alpha-1,3/alpha-1,6-mannosyltransferase